MATFKEREIPDDKVRAIVSEWLEKHPVTAEQWSSFYRRFCSTDDFNHEGAFWELYIGALLRTQGYSMQCEPDPHRTGSRRADFLVFQDKTPVFTVECKVILPERSTSRHETAAEKIRCGLDHQLQSARFPYHLHAKFALCGKREPDIRRIASFLRQQAESIPADIDISASRLEWVYRHEDSLLVFQPDRARHPDDAVICSWNMGDDFQVVRIEDQIREALKDKDPRKYGDGQLPFILALNVRNGWGEPTESLLAALFGQQAYNINERRVRRIPKAHQRRGASIKNTGLSGVIIGRQIMPWTAIDSTYEVVLLRSPYAERPFTSSLWRAKQLVLNEDLFPAETRGTSAVEILFPSR